MGQQQLILLVLATVIVGIAIVVGIRAFSENSAKANADAMMQDAVRLANDLQAWKQKPEPFGGQGQNCTTTGGVTTCAAYAQNVFTGATLAKLGYANATNLNGTYTLTPGTADAVITGTNTEFGNLVNVRVCGLDESGPNGIEGVIVDLNGVTGVGTAATACS